MAKVRLNRNNLRFLPRAQEFLDTYDFPEDLVRSVVMSPEHIERDPYTLEVGYPVIRMRRGDITVVVGVQDPHNPSVLYIYLHVPEDGVQRSGTKKGASGSHKSNKPTSIRQLRGWLINEGCSLEPSGSGHSNVMYDGIFVGSVASTPSEYRSVENAYHQLKKSLTSVKATVLARQWREAGKS